MLMETKRKYAVSICLLLIFGVMVSCKKEVKEISLLRRSLLYGNCVDAPVALYPMKLRCKETNDTAWSMMIGGDLYRCLNISFCDYDSFADLLAERVEKDGYLMVDSACFASYRQLFIEKDAVIDSIYQKDGIRGILENYVTERGELAASTPSQCDYLVFLLYQHRILCSLSEEYWFVMYVNFRETGREEEYLKMLENSKSTMYICPFYLSGKDSLEYVNKLKMNGEGWKLE